MVYTFIKPLHTISADQVLTVCAFSCGITLLQTGELEHNRHCLLTAEYRTTVNEQRAMATMAQMISISK